MTRHLLLKKIFCQIYKQHMKTVILVLCILLATLYVSNNWYQLLLIHGESMSPSYHNMQLVVLDRHSGEYTYGDVVAFQCDSLNALLIKRIAACPGDDVIIKDRLLFVNDKVSTVFPQEYIFEYPGIAFETVHLEDGQYFVIGDNMAQSKDSRNPVVGCIRIGDIWGKVI